MWLQKEEEYKAESLERKNDDKTHVCEKPPEVQYSRPWRKKPRQKSKYVAKIRNLRSIGSRGRGYTVFSPALAMAT